jgi:hypothetical protein
MQNIKFQEANICVSGVPPEADQVSEMIDLNTETLLIAPVLECLVKYLALQEKSP